MDKNSCRQWPPRLKSCLSKKKVIAVYFTGNSSLCKIRLGCNEQRIAKRIQWKQTIGHISFSHQPINRPSAGNKPIHSLRILLPLTPKLGMGLSESIIVAKVIACINSCVGFCNIVLVSQGIILQLRISKSIQIKIIIAP